MGEAEPAVEARSRAPRANAIPERFLGTLRRELLDPLLIINQRHAATVLQQYAHHHNDHRAAHSARPLPKGPFPTAPQPRSTTSDVTTGSAAGLLPAVE